MPAPAPQHHLNAIIVDDEKGCILNLQHFLSRLCPEINIIAAATNLQDALNNTDRQKIHLAFLDIELFNDNIFNSLTGIEKIDFKIVFVTAYSQYALKAIKVEAIDYILKPLCDEDILNCYAKTRKYFSTADQHSLRLPKNNKITIKHAGDVYIINAEDIYYVKAHGFYSEVVFGYKDYTKSAIISKPLNKLETEYQFSFLYRIHKSYLVNTNKILSLNKHDGLHIKMANNEIIPVAKRRIHDFKSFLNYKA